jgi:protein SCO1/2
MSAWRTIASVLIFVAIVPVAAIAADHSDVVAEFELVDSNGRTVSHMDFRGRHVLLAFGFTNCPHVCPMMAANMAGALNIAQSDATGIFISVDTERDSPEKVQAYASSFSDKMIGLGGAYQQVNAAAENFRVTYVVSKSQKNYTVQHTSSIFVIDPMGQITEIFPLNARPSEIATAMDDSD